MSSSFQPDISRSRRPISPDFQATSVVLSSFVLTHRTHSTTRHKLGLNNPLQIPKPDLRNSAASLLQTFFFPPQQDSVTQVLRKRGETVIKHDTVMWCPYFCKACSLFGPYSRAQRCHGRQAPFSLLITNLRDQPNGPPSPVLFFPPCALITVTIL